MPLMPVLRTLTIVSCLMMSTDAGNSPCSLAKVVHAAHDCIRNNWRGIPYMLAVPLACKPGHGLHMDM